MSVLKGCAETRRDYLALSETPKYSWINRIQACDKTYGLRENDYIGSRDAAGVFSFVLVPALSAEEKTVEITHVAVIIFT